MRTSNILLSLMALPLLVACAPPLPDSGARGAGFDTPAQVAQRREAQLTGTSPLQPSATIQPPSPGTVLAGGPQPQQPLGPRSEAQELADQTRAALGRPVDVATTAAPAPLPGATGPAGAALDRDNPSISSEQDFAAVSAERGIAADAERLRAARQQYQLVTPTELQRPESTGPNIFAYALGPAKPVGTQGAFRRGLGASESRSAAKCQSYRSDDIAQEDFLAAGGPERDRLGLDPDGDGNACAWDPSVVRRLVQN